MRGRITRFITIAMLVILVGFVVHLRERRKWLGITISNQTTEVVASVVIRGFGLTPSSITTGPVQPGQTLTLSFRSSGYSGYSLTPKFVSGKAYTTEEREGLGGYRITEALELHASDPAWDKLSFLYDRAFEASHGWLTWPIAVRNAR